MKSRSCGRSLAINTRTTARTWDDGFHALPRGPQMKSTPQQADFPKRKGFFLLSLDSCRAARKSLLHGLPMLWAFIHNFAAQTPEQAGALGKSHKQKGRG